MINNKNYSEGFTTLPKSKAKELIPYVAASCASYTNDESWITPLKLNLLSPLKQCYPISSSALKAHEKCFFDKKSGLKISVIEGLTELIIAFGAVGSGETEVASSDQKQMSQKQLNAAIYNLIGISSEVFEQAAQFVEEFSKLNAFGNKKIVVVGQSLGGALAQYVGLKHQLTTYCFNPIPLGSAQIKKLSQFQKLEDKNVCIISCEGDYNLISEHWINKVAQRVIQTPKFFGNKFTIPSAYKSFSETHNYFMGSLMKYLGYDIRTHLKSFPTFDSLFCNNTEQFKKAVKEIGNGLADLISLKEALKLCNEKSVRKKLKHIKENNQFIFNYLAFNVWLANEGRNMGDWCYGEHRLFETH